MESDGKHLTTWPYCADCYTSYLGWLWISIFIFTSDFNTVNLQLSIQEGLTCLHIQTRFWTSSKATASPSHAWFRILGYNFTYLLSGTSQKTFGYAVRCLKDTDWQFFYFDLNIGMRYIYSLFITIIQLIWIHVLLTLHLQSRYGLLVGCWTLQS